MPPRLTPLPPLSLPSPPLLLRQVQDEGGDVPGGRARRPRHRRPPARGREAPRGAATALHPGVLPRRALSLLALASSLLAFSLHTHSFLLAYLLRSLFLTSSLPHDSLRSRLSLTSPSRLSLSVVVQVVGSAETGALVFHPQETVAAVRLVNTEETKVSEYLCQPSPSLAAKRGMHRFVSLQPTHRWGLVNASRLTRYPPPSPLHQSPRRKYSWRTCRTATCSTNSSTA